MDDIDKSYPININLADDHYNREAILNELADGEPEVGDDRPTSAGATDRETTVLQSLKTSVHNSQSGKDDSPSNRFRNEHWIDPSDQT